MTDLSLTGRDLTLTHLADFDTRRPAVKLSESARRQMQASVETVREVMRTGRVCYGINTGFGALARQHISSDQLVQLQYNLVRSHACGVGQPLSPAVTRRILLLKANSLAIGNSGIRPEVVEALLALLNHDVLPVIPAKGSVGASGDLAPLAHLALTLIGEGEAEKSGKLLQGKAVLDAAGIPQIQLQAKEGLALLNGTQVSSALAIEGLLQARTALLSAIVIGALTLEGLAGSYSPFDERIHAVRNLQGQMQVAEWFRNLLTGSEIWKSHQGCDRVQDPYAVRCMPQVFGAVGDTLAHAAQVLARECNSVSDNPLIFGNDVLSGGNFHAEPLAFVADFMAIAATELGTMSERRTDLMLRKINPRLEMFLARAPGVESGFMLAHVTAAALASENKTLAHPASVDTIPTSAGQEDHVSMAPWAGRKLLQILENLHAILAIEALAAAAAVEAQRPLHTTPELENAVARIRETAPAHTGDRRLDGDIRRLAAALQAGLLLDILPADAGRWPMA
ncbi:MAG: histidine ammonia-lyase [Gammaproteobacteria bacterium]|nr:histidine ammonia-lyase [Gammaproteobacteria bacterium]MBU6509856.1 histidine ammonia-lyase [Gammaproteobacteria bacterium]MDE1983997.1 histidine ammonia-lyase [Gammaproteobacteria bacterium]MDE2108068.1 histidine ammonia-lyase [Gammaproteobacteria bacterium]MDE2461391.1 histidine ammonia-lyase [Gammaproteobacteria bacterium]